jgi:hypothetical protein
VSKPESRSEHARKHIEHCRPKIGRFWHFSEPAFIDFIENEPHARAATPCQILYFGEATQMNIKPTAGGNGRSPQNFHPADLK